MQYYPYGYYNEHCIVFNKQHIPMTINAQVFNKLFDFVEQFPHYFIGSNADLIFGRNNTSMGMVMPWFNISLSGSFVFEKEQRE